MIEQLKSKLKELEIKKQELQPKIDKIEEKKAEEIQELNKKYDHMFQDANIRNTSEYMVTVNFKEFREKVSEIELFPRDLIERLDKVIEGGLIENIAYDLEKIETEYKNH